ncbi:Tripartite-type tricarboxylate transporter, receptor component TctC [Variovorax sp. CF079]|uniref:Bug family tripartite tricarboxylate transporter substrate binding protein n=1 Tax=Variovorax sp. CF079 TaxID=1882774 RepID=UPI0008826E5A|nr:tripartite tricarboxylate transporter substrate binding protein [Variovorax sp. CF079]SDE93771.1 Tripartite-type tricarboxylate transporter, receptor component TctC [Variovorax sp. CF079]
MRKIATIRTLSMVIAACAAASAWAWPDKPVQVIVPYGAGGGVDTFTRPLTAKMGELLGQPIVVDNRGGAGGTIGVQRAAVSPPDGYILLSGGVHQPMAEGLYPKRGYDIEKDFVPLALTARVPNVLVVTSKAPYADVKELIAHAKANPGKVNYCSSGNGTAQHIVGATFGKLTGVTMTHIPYRGTAAAMTDLISGQCDLMFDGLGTSAQQIQNGRIRLLAVTTTKRSPLFPQTPTLKEAGGPEMDASIWYAWWAPAATPKDVVAKLRQDLQIALKEASVREAWRSQGAEVPEMADSALDGYVKAETRRWKKAVQEMGITVD